MLEKWKKYQAKEVQSGIDENGNRLISFFAKDYKIVMGNEFCPSCNDFEIKFKNFITKLENMKNVKKTGFVLKAMFENITLFGSQQYFNNANLTDESAIELLEKHPKGKDLFEAIPEGWEKLKATKVEKAVKAEKVKTLKPKTPKAETPKVEKVEGVIVLFEKETSIDDAKDLFKSAGIDSRATTVVGLEKSLSEATDEQKEALNALINPTLEDIDVDTSEV